MSGAPRRTNRLWGYLLVEVLSVAAGAVVVVVAPFRSFDDVWREAVLQGASIHEPARGVVVLEVAPTLARANNCGQVVTEMLTVGGARAGLVLEPLTAVCHGILDGGDEESELAPPLSSLSDDVFRRGRGGQLVGLSPAARRSDLVVALKFTPNPWIASRVAEAVPVLTLESAAGQSSGPATLEGRIAVVALDKSSTPGGLSARSIAALLGAASEDPRRRLAPPWALALLALAINGALVSVQRRSEARGRLRRSVLVSLGALGVVGAADWLAMGWLLPLPSLVFGVIATTTGLAVPRRLVEAREARDAKRVLRDAGRMVNAGASTSDDADFWKRLARTATQAHPADDVVVAELPAFSWRLKFWSNGETGDDLIRERRRDIRRTPYCNSQGVPEASVVHDYLVMKGTPAVLVPMIVTGEVEGFLMLVGQPAVDEFRANPNLSDGLARDLGQLIRNRRVASMEQEAFQSPAGLSHVPVTGGRVVLDQARAAMAELRLLGAMVQDAPIGLFYVDSFGDVRILGRAVTRWLPDFGLDIPAQGVNGSLDPGSLSLKRLLGAFARKANVVPPPFTEIGEAGYSLEVPVPVKAGRRIKSIDVRVVQLKTMSTEVDGFVGSLAESAIRTQSTAPYPSIMAQTVASLQVFSLSKMVTSVVGDAAHRTGGKVRLQTPRDDAFVVAHRAELQTALLEFLVEAALRVGKSKGPVVAIGLGEQRVELTILDLRLDAPTPALERTLMAPSNPPPGLDSLAELVRAVENGHGEVDLRTEKVWGTVLVASLIRARPRVVENAPDISHLRLHNRPVKVE